MTVQKYSSYCTNNNTFKHCSIINVIRLSLYCKLYPISFTLPGFLKNFPTAKNFQAKFYKPIVVQPSSELLHFTKKNVKK